MSDLPKPEHLRSQAETLRRQASAARDPEYRDALLLVAREYDKLAKVI